jgi:D-methionine transport system permease protein
MTDAQLLDLLSKAFVDTLWIVGGSSFFGILGGLPLGIVLVLTQKQGLYPQPVLNTVLNRIVNLFRSIPFYILVVALMPLSRFVVGTSIGIKATIFVLSVGAIPFVARLSENILREVDPEVVDAVITMGAAPKDVVGMLFKESLPSLINGLSVTVIMLIGYSAMAGLLGGGGLGDIAIRYGYYRFNYTVLYLALFILIVLVELIQTLSHWLVKRLDHKAR